MITLDYCRLMARYNAWQNDSLLAAADTLDHAQRWQDRGAFFGSIAATLNHLYWGDTFWLERLAGNERPQDTLSPSLDKPADWDDFKRLRKERDHEILRWAAALDQSALEGQVVWYLGNSPDRNEQLRTVCIAGLFNHQTHHRGQVHCMLTAAGTSPEATDLILLG